MPVAQSHHVPRSRPVPPLQNGDKLNRVEFERRYNAMPDVKKAELIEGIVYMASAVRHTQHGKPHLKIGAWVGYYLGKTPGVDGGDNCTIRLDDETEPQPDLLLRLEQSAGGTSRVDEDGYLTGPVELAIEVAASSVSLDMHLKMEAYRSHGVHEYLVHRVEDEVVNWFRLENGKYVEIVPDEEGILRSKIFPGLWLSPAALIKGDIPALFAVLDRGIATQDHVSFVARLAADTSR